jgi:hypothetical protein
MIAILKIDRLNRPLPRHDPRRGRQTGHSNGIGR